MIVLSSLLRTVGPQTEVANQHADGEIELLRIDAAYRAVIGILHIHVGDEVVDEVVGNLLHVFQRVFRRVSILLSQNRLCDEWHLAIDECQLQISPGTISLHHSILLVKDWYTTLGQLRVGIRQEVVTVLDDGIIVTGIVVGVVGIGREVGHVLQFQGGVLRERCQVATQLTQQDGAVSHHLHLVNDAHERIERIVGGVETVILHERDQLAIGLGAAHQTLRCSGKTQYGCCLKEIFI